MLVGDLIAIAPGLGLGVVRLDEVLDVLEAVVAAGRGHGHTKTKPKRRTPNENKNHMWPQVGSWAMRPQMAAPLAPS